MVDTRNAAGRGAGPSQAKEQLWRERVARQSRSKLSIREYCARAGVSEPSFYAWRRELARRDALASQAVPVEPKITSSQAKAAPRKPTASQRKANSAPRFLPVKIAATAAPQVEILLPSGLIVRVPAHDAAALRTVLELLERPAC